VQAAHKCAECGPLHSDPYNGLQNPRWMLFLSTSPTHHHPIILFYQFHQQRPPESPAPSSPDHWSLLPLIHTIPLEVRMRTGRNVRPHHRSPSVHLRLTVYRTWILFFFSLASLSSCFLSAFTTHIPIVIIVFVYAFNCIQCCVTSFCIALLSSLHLFIPSLSFIYSTSIRVMLAFDNAVIYSILFVALTHRRAIDSLQLYVL